MGTKEVSSSSKAREGAIREKLDALNAKSRRQRVSTIRRAMEADLEAKSKKRRSTQAPTSSAWKASTFK
jgi:hypothetical protein